MNVVNTLRIGKGSVFFGPGPKLLLQTVEKTASLRKATMQTGISYTKALRLLKKMEKELGFAVVESEKGGSERGGTHLTEQGIRLLRAYEQVEREVDAVAQKLVAEHFAFIEENNK